MAKERLAEYNDGVFGMITNIRREGVLVASNTVEILGGRKKP